MKKYAFLVLLFLFFASTLFAQDKIITKQGTTLNVKIIYVDNSNIYFYQTLDTEKTIRLISKKAITEYQYLSIDNGKNIEVVKSDSVLFSNYLRKTKGIYQPSVIDYGQINTDFNSTSIDSVRNQKAIRNRELELQQLNLNHPFRKPANCIIWSGGFMLVGTILQLYNINRSLPSSTATNADYERFLNDSKMLSNFTYGFYGMSGILLLRAGVNLNTMKFQFK